MRTACPSAAGGKNRRALVFRAPFGSFREEPRSGWPAHPLSEGIDRGNAVPGWPSSRVDQFFRLRPFCRALTTENGFAIAVRDFSSKNQITMFWPNETRLFSCGG